MEGFQPFIDLAIALGLGLLIGLQREKKNSHFAGIRTFPLFGMAGVISAYISLHFESIWIIFAGLLCITLLSISSNYIRIKQADDIGDGQTTEMAAILMYLIGVGIAVEFRALSVVIGAIVALLLHLKASLNSIVEQFGEKDMRAIMQFAAIFLVVLPLLPDKDFGPYEVLNPREIWMMVVLIVGLSVTAYFIYKWVGKSLGTIMGGVLGGLISSTATTLTYAKRTKGTEGTGRLAAIVILIASTISFVRVLIEIAIVIPNKLWIIAPPIIVVILFMSALCLGIYFWNDEEDRDGLPEPENPAQLKSALIFGGLYALIILAVAWGKDVFGNEGLYIISIISGLTDVDAITLSLANTIKGGGIEAKNGWHLILIAALANMVFKAGITISIGSRKLAKLIVIATLITIVVGVLVILLWPEAWQGG